MSRDLLQLTELGAAARLAIAALVGLAVGIEREWSQHATGREPRFAGMRTFFMLGLLGGCAGLLVSQGHDLAATGIIGGAAILAAAAYGAVAFRHGASVDGTTEAAALVVIALGTLAGLGWLVLAAGAASVVVLALNEKKHLHSMVEHLHEDELRAALRFSVLAVVILPLLPERAAIGAFTIEPRNLWMIVLFFSALNFATYVVRRAVGTKRGFGMIGMLGGLLSSTAVTLVFSRRSRREPVLAGSLAHGVVGACTVLIPRVLVISALLNVSVALRLLPIVAPALAIGLWIVWRDWARGGTDVPVAETDASASDGNPLRLVAAIELAIVFQVAMSLIEFVRDQWSTSGVYASAVVIGLTNADALTVGMARSVPEMPAPVAARAIAVGILANTVFKLGLSLTFGDVRFRRTAGAALASIAVVTAASLWLF